MIDLNTFLKEKCHYSDEQIKTFQEVQEKTQMPIEELLEGYTPDEQNAILADLVKLIEKQFLPKTLSKNPCYITTAGAPCSGKSYFIEEKYLLDTPERTHVYTDPDRVGLPAITQYVEEAKTDSGAAYNKWRDASNFIGNFLLVKAVTEKRNLVHGTTATKERFIGLYQYLKDLGYTLHVEAIFATPKQRIAAVQHRSKDVVQVTEEDFASKAKPVFFRILDAYLPKCDFVNFHFQQGDFWLGTGSLECFARFSQEQKSVAIINQTVLSRFQQELEATLTSEELKNIKQAFENWGLYKKLNIAHIKSTLHHDVDQATEKELQQKTLKEIFQDQKLTDFLIDKIILPELHSHFGWSRVSRDQYEQERRNFVDGKKLRKFPETMIKHCIISPTVNDWPQNFLQIVEQGLENWDCNRIKDSNYILGKGPLCTEDLVELFTVFWKENVEYVVGIGERFGEMTEQEVLEKLNENNFFDFHNYFNINDEKTIISNDKTFTLRTEILKPGEYEDGKLVSWSKNRLFITRNGQTKTIDMIVLPAPDRGSVQLTEEINSELQQLIQKQQAGSKVYMHCTHGMGRASYFMGLLLYMEKLAPYLSEEKPFKEIQDEIKNVFVEIAKQFRTSRATCYCGTSRVKDHLEMAIQLMNASVANREILDNTQKSKP